MKTFLSAALLAGGLIVTTATAASAHTASVDRSRICTDEGETKTVVTFSNDYNLTATVTYHWGSDSTSTVSLAAKSGASTPTVSLPSHDVGTLKYHVTWSDNYRQPSEGDASLAIGSLTDCHAVTTTSSSSSTTTSSTTSTTLKPAENTVQPATTENAIVVPVEVKGVQLVRPGPTPVGGVQTGGGGTSQSGHDLLPLGVALGCVGLVGLVTMHLRRRVS